MVSRREIWMPARTKIINNGQLCHSSLLCYWNFFWNLRLKLYFSLSTFKFQLPRSLNPVSINHVSIFNPSVSECVATRSDVRAGISSSNCQGSHCNFPDWWIKGANCWNWARQQKLNSWAGESLLIAIITLQLLTLLLIESPGFKEFWWQK